MRILIVGSKVQDAFKDSLLNLKEDLIEIVRHSSHYIKLKNGTEILHHRLDKDMDAEYLRGLHVDLIIEHASITRHGQLLLNRTRFLLLR